MNSKLALSAFQWYYNLYYIPDFFKWRFPAVWYNAFLLDEIPNFVVSD